jgi:hypothetical protein
VGGDGAGMDGSDLSRWTAQAGSQIHIQKAKGGSVKKFIDNQLFTASLFLTSRNHLNI